MPEPLPNPYVDLNNARNLTRREICVKRPYPDRASVNRKITSMNISATSKGRRLKSWEAIFCEQCSSWHLKHRK